MRKKIAESESITLHEAAIILGIAKDTLYKGLRKGKYREISIERHVSGWQLDLVDVFEYAYPGMSEETIAMLIYKYRADRIERRRKKK